MARRFVDLLVCWWVWFFWRLSWYWRKCFLFVFKAFWLAPSYLLGASVWRMRIEHGTSSVEQCSHGAVLPARHLLSDSWFYTILHDFIQLYISLMYCIVEKKVLRRLRVGLTRWVSCGVLCTRLMLCLMWNFKHILCNVLCPVLC